MRKSLQVCLLVAAALATGCASTGAVPRPFPLAGTPTRPAQPDRPDQPSQPVQAALPDQAAQPDQPSHPDQLARSVIDASALTGTALSLRGKPYRNGGADPSGFDCSGFTQYVFWHHGIALPRDVKAQFGAGRAVTLDEIAPGDLLFFATVAPGASHVGIALDRQAFVHAPSSSGVVRVEQVTSTYWSRRFVGARRIG